MPITDGYRKDFAVMVFSRFFLVPIKILHVVIGFGHINWTTGRNALTLANFISTIAYSLR